jgi:hypothetical protein
MSLFSLPVTSADIVALQQGILFTTTNAADINNQVSSINAPGTTETVASYANQLLASVQATSQMAMGVSALETGANQTVAELTTLVTNPGVIPAYVNFAASRGLDAGQVVGENLGLAFSGAAGFANLAGMSTGAFAAAVGGTFGISQSFLVGQVQFFINLYSSPGGSPFPGNPNPTAAQIQAAANGVVFGLAVALNIEGVSSPTSIATTTQTQVKNALFDIAQTGQPGGATYTPGLTLPSHPVPTPFQSGPNVTGVFLTQNIDSPTAGFSSSANGTPVLGGFTATLANTTFQALPFVTALGLGNNTLNTGDDLETTGAATGATTLTYVTAGGAAAAANPPFAQGITMVGVNTLNITNNNTVATAGSVTAGFSGAKITGLLVENNLNSVNPVTLGATGQGLGTLLTNINISGNGTNTTLFDVNTVILAAGIADLTKTINVGITGDLGKTSLGGAATINIASDAGAGTAATPSKTYGTWSITSSGTENLQLGQSAVSGALGLIATTAGVGAATGLTLAGAGTYALGQAAAGNWQLLKTIDESATTGKVVITGASAGNATHFLASAANPLWLFGSAAGLLDDTGTGGVFNLTNVKLGTGLDVLDISSATAAQVAALTTVAGTGSPTGDILIVQDAVATTTTAATFANIAGFTTLGIGGPTVAQGAAGTINMANLPASINNITYMTRAAGAVVINNGASTLTVNVNHNSPNVAPVNSSPLAINAAGTGITDSLTVMLGDATGTVGGIVGANVSFAPVGAGGSAIDGLSSQGYENVTIASAGPAGQANVLSGNSLSDVFSASPGGNETLTLQGAAPLFTNAIFVNGLGGTGAINDNLTGTLDIWAFGNNTNPPTASGPTFIATNAAAINGGPSGGVLMGGSDVFFNGLTGDILTGSATKNNVLAGSVSNDTFTGGSGKDLIITDNGADKISLGAGHTGDLIDLFFGDFAGNGGGFNGTVAGTFNAVTGLVNSITSNADTAHAGTWGVAPAINANGTPADSGQDIFNALFPRTTATNNGTSADQSVVTGFTGGDALQFSTGAWGVGAGVGGLVNANFVHIAAGTGANIQTVSAGQMVPTGTNIIELNQDFPNANAVALALGNNIGNGGSSYNLIFPVNIPAARDHILVAYNDGNNNAHIADVDIFGGAGTMSKNSFVVASDMVQLTGVSVTTLTNANFHFVA